MDCEVVYEALLSFEISKRALRNANPIMSKSMSVFRQVPGKLHMLECFILSGTGRALIIPRTVD